MNEVNTVDSNNKMIRGFFLIILIIITVIFAIIIGIIYFIASKYTTSLNINLENSITDIQAEKIKEEIKNICKTEDIEYISKEDALQQMKEDFGEELLSNYEENNIFPSSYIVNVKFNEKYKIHNELKKIDGIDKIISNNITTNVILILIAIYIIIFIVFIILIHSLKSNKLKGEK